MEISWRVLCFCIGLGIIELCNGLPIELFSTNEGPNAQLIGVLVAVMVSVCVVLAFVGCACCQRRRGFKEFRDSPVTASVVNDSTLTGDDPGHVNPIASSEFTIFTPLSPPHHNNNVFRTHHQPVISYIQNENVPETQNKLNNTQIDGLDVSSWFDGSQTDFPRTKLKYIRELGSGWFGRVVEGEAQGINNNHNDGWTPVAVRILESSASAHEQALFLHEASIYRIEQSHQHVLKLWGRSLEATPLLLIQEFCPRGDLKKFLLENQSCSTSPVMLGLPLQFCCQLASAVQYLHDNNIPHLDLAARTCQITSDMTLKLGDYGLAVSRYSRDYYQGTPAIPVRWCAPESLNYTNTTLQPKQVTLAGNIWSLGVTMWEICEWGAQPYDWLTDDEVVSQVMGAPHIRLPQPNLSVYYIHPLYRLMQLCWQNSESRPLIPQIYAMLLHLMQTYQQENSSKSPSKIPEFSIEDFDSRWDTFKPNTIVKTDNHISSDVKLTGCTDKTTDLTSLSSTSEVYMNPSVRKSDSLTNLHGSFENLADDADAEVETPVQNMDSWLQNVASHTGDMQYVRGLSQAIQALDSALALEQTSSSGSSYQHSPAPEHWDARTPPNKPYQPKIEFKLGLTQKSAANDSTNLMDSIFLARRSESGSETEDETWRKRIERGAYSEKVRQKSKSVADLMVLTHIDCSDTDSETPLQSLEYKVNKNVRCVTKNSLENSSLMFGSEGNLLAVQDTFQEELRKLQEERRDSLLFVPARHSSDGDITGSVSADVHQCISRNDCDNHTNDNVLDLSDIMLHGSFVTSDIVYSTPEKKYSQSYTQNTDQISASDIVKHSVPVTETQTSDTPSTHTSLAACETGQKLAKSNVIKTTEVTDELSDVPSKPSDCVKNLPKSTSVQSYKTSEIISPMKSTDYINIHQKLIHSEQENTSELLDNQPKTDVPEKHISEIVNFKAQSVAKSNKLLIVSNNDESENPDTSSKNPVGSVLNASYFTSETREISQSDRKSDPISTDPISAVTDLNLSDCSSQSRENRVDIFEGVSDDSVIPDTSMSSSSLTDIDHKPQHSPDSNLEFGESEIKPDTVDRVENFIGSMHTAQPLDISKTVDFLRNEQESESFSCIPEIEHINTIEGCEESLSKNEEILELPLTDAKSHDIVETDVIHENSQVTKNEDTHKESNEDYVTPVNEESKINLEEIHKEKSVELLSLAKENVELKINEQNFKLEDTKVISDSSLDNDIKELLPKQQPKELVEGTLGTSSVEETTVDNSVSESNFVHIKEETSMVSNIISNSEDSFENITKETITTNLSAQIEEFLQNEQLFQPPSPILIPVHSEPSNENIIATSVLYPNVEERRHITQEPTKKLDLVDISMPSESSETEAKSVESSSNEVNEENIIHMKSSDKAVRQNANIETVEQFLNKTIEDNRNVESESNNIEIAIDQSKEPRIQFEDSQPVEQSVDISVSKEPSSYLQNQNLLEITSEVEIKLAESSMNNDSSVPEKFVIDEHPKSEVINDKLLSDSLVVLKSEEIEASTKNSEVTVLTTDVDLVPEIAKEFEREHEKVDLDFTNLPTEIIPSKLSEDENQSTTEEVQPQQILGQSEQDKETSDINNESFKNIVVPSPDMNHKIITSQFLYSEQEYASSQPENISSPVIIISEVKPEISPMEMKIKNSHLTDIDQSVVEVDENEFSCNVVLDKITAAVESQQASKESDTEQDVDTTNKRAIIMATTIPESQHDISKTVLPSCTDADNATNDSKHSSTVTYIPSETESQKDHQYPVESPQEEEKTDVITSEKNKPFLRRIPTIIIEDVEKDTEDPVVDYETLITCLNNNDKQNESIMEHDTEQKDETLIEQKPNAQSIENNSDKNVIQSFIANEIAASVVPVNTNTLTNKEVKDIINNVAINSSLDCAENVKSQSAENADDVETTKLGNEEITTQDSGVINECKKLETSANNEYAISTIREGTQLDESYGEQKVNDVESTHAHDDCKSEALAVEAKSKEDKVEETLVNTLKDEENSAIKSDIGYTTEVITALNTSLSEKRNDGKNEVEEVPEFSDEIDKISDKASSTSKTDNSLEKTTETDNSDSVQEKMTQMHETVSDNIIDDRSQVKEETLMEANLTAYDNESRSLDVKSDEEDRYSESDILSALENEYELCVKETDKSTSETQNIEEINADKKQAQTDDERKAQFSLIQNFINTERNFGSKDVDFVPSIMDPKVELAKDESGSNKENEITNVVQDTTTSLLDLDTLNDPSNVHQMNQVYNVFSVTVDHRPPVECFTSPVKNLYNKVFDQHELMTDINDLLLENDRKLIENKSPEKLISDLSSVCTSSLPNEQLLNVLNNPPLVNGFDNEISDKFIVEGKNLNLILEDCVTPHKTKLNYDITKTPATNGELNVTKTVPEIIENSPTSNSKETQCNEVNRCDEIRKEQVTDLDDSDDSFTENRNELAPDNTMNTRQLMTSTPFTKKFIPTRSDDDCKDNIFSFVSEGDEQNSDFQTTVILGPCEDYTLGLYSGLKTTFEKYADDDRPEEELLQFSSNFMPFDEDKAALKINEVHDKYFENNRTFDMNQSVDYSLETWDRFLGKSLLDQQQNSVFDHFAPKPESVDIFRDKEIKQSEVKSENDEHSKQLDSTYNCKEASPVDKVENENGTFILDKTYDKDVVKENSPDQVVSSSWEPGEGWFLHPQVPPEDLTGQIDISTSDNVDNSYVGFTLDEECVNALRSELAAKLPHAQGMTHEEQQEQDDWDAEERSEIIVKYNVYATPLSPIPEESYCDDAYSDQIQNRDGSDSESDWSEPCMGRTSQLEDILVVDTETHTALILESPSLREPQHRHTPSQDSCCSNDTLFNLEDLNYGPVDADNSPHHHALTAQSSQSSEPEDLILHVEVTDNETLKLSLSNDDEEDAELPSQKEDLQAEQLDLTISNGSVEDMNITYTKPQINIDIADVKSLEEDDHSSEKEYVHSEKEEPVSSGLVSEATEEKTTEDKPSESKSSHKLELKLEAGAFGVAPLPSPEDIPWRQLPASLLTYNEVVQNDKFDIQQESDNAESEELDIANDDESTEIAADTNIGQDKIKLEEDLSDSVPEGVLDTDLYSNLTDIRFSGPCDTQLMSTSFSESADYAEERDWDSGSDTRSSSSGEFIWKEGEHEESLRALHAASHDVGVTEDLNPMDAIEEENTDSSNDDSDDDDGDEDIEETEFVPSAWDAQATPTKSALRSPEKSNKRKNQQKGVWFKKQKYHCVYEYPREPESPVAPNTDLWRPLSDFSNFTDWELDPESCVPPFEDQATTECRDSSYDTVLDKYISRTNYPLASGSARHRDLYQLNPFPDFATGITGTDEDFFISSSARPFQTLGQGSQFFPGQDTKSKGPWQEYQSSSSQSSKDYSDNITPDSGVEDVTPASISDITLSQQIVQLSPPKTKVQSLKHLAAVAANKTASNDTKVQDSLGGLRHTRNRLKLDLPPSPNSFTSNRTFTIDIPNDPVVNREVPTFTTFGKSRFSVQHVQTPTEDVESTATGIQTKSKNVSFEALPYKPMLVSSSNSVFILDNADRNGKHKPVEMVQGEASLLDSADEDSGIESSANATLERHHQQVFH